MAASILRWSCVAAALEGSAATRPTEVLSLVQTKAVTLEKRGHPSGTTKSDHTELWGLASDSVRQQFEEAIAQSNEDENLVNVDSNIAKEKFEAAVSQADTDQHLVDLASDDVKRKFKDAVAHAASDDLRGLASQVVEEDLEVAAAAGGSKRVAKKTDDIRGGFYAGEGVTLHSLPDAPEFNGAKGILKMWTEEPGHWEVQVQDSSDRGGDRRVQRTWVEEDGSWDVLLLDGTHSLIKPENLKGTSSLKPADIARQGAKPASRGNAPHSSEDEQSPPALLAKGDNEHLTFSAPASAQAQQVDTDTAQLADMSTLLRESDKVSANISSTMAVLESRLGEAQHRSVEEVSSQRTEYESKLEAQQSESHATELLNAQFAVRIHEMRKANTQFRAHAESLANETKVLKSGIQDIREDVGGAAEIANASMQLSEVMLHNAKELKVLTELDEQDDKLAHQKLLDAIGGVHMLQGKPKTSREQPQQLLQSVMSSLGNFSNEQNVSMSSLKETFEKKFQVGAAKQQLLLEKSDKLKGMWESEQELHERLSIAIKHLQSARQQLIEQERAIATYIAFGNVAGGKDARSNGSK